MSAVMSEKAQSAVRRWPCRMVAYVLLALSLALGAVLASQPQVAFASAPAFVNVKKGKAANTATKLTAKEKTAYKRALKAVMDYEHQPKTITLDISDLKLTNAQALRVGYLLHSNGEIFWVNTYNDDYFTKDRFILPCIYDDATITTMRAKLDKAVNKALKRLGSGMDKMTKLQTLHDFMIENVDYADHSKTAYDALVLHKADCFGYTQGMDLLLRRAGFSTDMAYNFAGTHSWNLVKLSGKWYHIDVTWDHGFTGNYFWKKNNCYLYFLQPDSRMADDGYSDDGHGRWWAQHTCTSKKYLKDADMTDRFVKNHNKYKLYTKGFKAGGLKYKLVGPKKAVLVGVTGSKNKRAKTLTLPATVTYKKASYKVVGIGSSALAKAKCKTLVVASGSLSKARLKGSLLGSKVKTVRLSGAAARKKSTYKKYFKKSVCGRAVKVKRS